MYHFLKWWFPELSVVISAELVVRFISWMTLLRTGEVACCEAQSVCVPPLGTKSKGDGSAGRREHGRTRRVLLPVLSPGFAERE